MAAVLGGRAYIDRASDWKLNHIISWNLRGALVEAGFIDLKMRRVPAMVAETIWNPLADQTELERRCRMIWDGSVGGWPTTPSLSLDVVPHEGLRAATPLPSTSFLTRMS